jgi:uncharacterized membrane protein
VTEDQNTTPELTTLPYGTPHRRLWRGIWALLRTRIAAGLLTVIPIWVTWVVIKFVFDLMRSATQPIVEGAAGVVLEQNQGIVPARVQDYVDWIVPLLAVGLTLFLLYVLGLLTANVFGRRLIVAMEMLLHRLPLVKTIYRSTKQVVVTLGGGDSPGFQRVVLVEFPRPGMKCIGFLTAVMTDVDTGRRMASIFISTTPNPTTGYMQIVPLDEVSETNWTVEEAVKPLMSGGVLSPPTVAFDRIHPVRFLPPLAEGAVKPAQVQPGTTPERVLVDRKS